MDRLQAWGVLSRLSEGSVIPTRDFAEELLRRAAESYPLAPRTLYVEPMVAAYRTLEGFRRKAEPAARGAIPDAILDAYFEFLVSYEYFTDSREPTPSFEAEIRGYQRNHGVRRTGSNEPP